MVKKRVPLYLDFYEQDSGVWVWEKKSNIIKIYQIDSIWVAESSISSPSVKDNISLHSQSTDFELVLYDLLKLFNPQDFLRVFGLKSVSQCSIRSRRIKKSIQGTRFYRGKKTSYKAQRKFSTLQLDTILSNEAGKCPWFGVKTECDNSGDCFFCASYGTSYLMRSDD